jgi:hypothetical protein
MAEELTEAQKAILARVQSRLIQDQSIYPEGPGAVARPPAQSQMGRMGLQGMTFGFGDEIEAAIRSMVPGGATYEVERDKIRQELAQYQAENPGKAITMEILGSLATNAGAGVFNKVRGAISSGKTVPAIRDVAKVGAFEGGLYGLGTSEAEDLTGMALDTSTGTLIGAAVPASLTGAVRAGGGLFRNVADYAREKFGNRASNAVQAEIMRIIEKTEKSADEIVQDIIDGRIISDNATLLPVLKNFVVEGGQSGAEVLRRGTERAGTTSARAQGELARSLTPGMDQNVIRAMRKTDEALKELENKAYKTVFEQAGDLSGDLSEQLLSIYQRYPEIATDAQRLYGRRNLVPLLGTADNGAVGFARAPNLEDAEIAYRMVRDLGGKEFREGSGTMGTAVADDASVLKNAIDAFSPDLSAARMAASTRRGISENFKQGKLALGKDPDEIPDIIEDLANKPEQLQAYRAGVMAAIRFKAKKNKTTLGIMAKEDSQFGTILRYILPEEDIDRVARQLDIAGQSQEIASKLPNTAGSPTELLRRERAASGMNVGLEEMGRAANFDPRAIVGMVSKMIAKETPGLSDAERMGVVNILYSDNPSLVMDALNNKDALDRLMDMISNRISQVAPAARRATTQQSVGLLSGIMDGNQ